MFQSMTFIHNNALETPPRKIISQWLFLLLQLIPKDKYPDWGRTGEDISLPKITVWSMYIPMQACSCGKDDEILRSRTVVNIIRELNTLVKLDVWWFLAIWYFKIQTAKGTRTRSPWILWLKFLPKLRCSVSDNKVCVVLCK